MFTSAVLIRRRNTLKIESQENKGSFLEKGGEIIEKKGVLRCKTFWLLVAMKKGGGKGRRSATIMDWLGLRSIKSWGGEKEKEQCKDQPDSGNGRNSGGKKRKGKRNWERPFMKMVPKRSTKAISERMQERKKKLKKMCVKDRVRA